MLDTKAIARIFEARWVEINAVRFIACLLRRLARRSLDAFFGDITAAVVGRVDCGDLFKRWSRVDHDKPASVTFDEVLLFFAEQLLECATTADRARDCAPAGRCESNAG